ncbi:MAG TPA: A24 family peptidase [Nitrospiria bacterium]
MKEKPDSVNKEVTSPSSRRLKSTGLEKTASALYAAALVGLLAVKPEVFLISATLLFILLVCLWDWRSYRIPNLFTYPTMAAALIYHAAAAGWSGILLGIFGVFLGGSLLLLPHLMGGVGAGDVKTLAALGALWGAGPALQIFIITALMGGIVAVAILIARGELMNNLKRYWSILKVLVVTRKFIYIGPSHRVREFKIPYGAVISLGVAAWLFGGPLLQELI